MSNSFRKDGDWNKFKFFVPPVPHSKLKIHVCAHIGYSKCIHKYLLKVCGSNLKAGGIAGISVDAGLFPLDTIKTRLQSPDGFVKAGGFRGVYSGLGTAALGSAPTGRCYTWSNYAKKYST